VIAAPIALGEADDQGEPVMNERSVFIDALDIGDRVARSAFLDHACAGDPSLRADVEKLLSAHEAPGAFMQRPAVDLAGSTVRPASSINAGPSAAQASPAPAVSGYEILVEVGRGGMGIVYKARQIRLKRIVALKMLLAGPHAANELRTRLRTEAETVARLHHPNIVQIYEVGDAGPCPFLALEYVDGGTLKSKLSGTPQPALAAARLVETLARAAQYAHEHGVVHRDLKPGNILMVSGAAVRGESSGDNSSSTHHSPLTTHQPKIVDFGLAKHWQTDAPAADGATATGTILGTPAYMAPEQAAGKPAEVGPAADIYALGAILYELVSGRPPFQAETAVDALHQVRFQEPIPPSRLRPRLPRDIETICLKCLEKDPARRYSSAEALAEDLRRFQANEPITARRIGVLARGWRWCSRKPAAAILVVVVTLFLAGTLGAAFWYVQDRAERRTLHALRAAEATRETERAVAEARTRRDEAFGESDNPERWQAGMAAALSTLRRAEFLAAKHDVDHVDVAVVAMVGELRTQLEADEDSRKRAGRLEEIRVESGTLVDGQFTPNRISERYRNEFRAAGLDVESGEIAILAAQIRRSAIRDQLVAAVDEWAYVAEPAPCRRLLQIAGAVDDDAWRNRFRRAWSEWNRDHLRALTDDPALAEQPSYVAVLLGRLLAHRYHADALRIVRLAQERRPSDFWTNCALGEMLYRDRPADAVGYYRAALAARPRNSMIHDWIGLCLYAQNDLTGATRAYRQAIALDAKNAKAHNNLAAAQRAQNDLPGALASLKAAIAADANNAHPHYNLANLLRDQRDFPAAVVEYQRAIALNETMAAAHCNLGLTLREQGKFGEALAALRIGDKLSKAQPKWGNPSADWIRQCETLLEYDRKLPAVLQGDVPANAGERFLYAEVCKYRGLHVSAVSLYRQAFTASPQVENTANGIARYHAACSAGLAASGTGEDASRLSDPARADLRRQALLWLRAELAHWTKRSAGNAVDRALVQKTLTTWQRDMQLTAVRDADSLATLPDDEQRAWAQLWTDVAALRNRSKAPSE
jgi:eukaryotic-like serine/threonine-protein kinase